MHLDGWKGVVKGLLVLLAVNAVIFGVIFLLGALGLAGDAPRRECVEDRFGQTAYCDQSQE